MSAPEHTDPGYWCFTRQQLDTLLRGLNPVTAATVLQLLDSADARRLGLHHLPTSAPASEGKP